jgi:hypothetical protein
VTTTAPQTDTKHQVTDAKPRLDHERDTTQVKGLEAEIPGLEERVDHILILQRHFVILMSCRSRTQGSHR